MFHYNNVHMAMQGYGQCSDLPDLDVPDEDTRLLRARLLLEETLEQIEALGCSVVTHGKISLPHDKIDVLIDPNREPDMVELADAIADVQVINTGTAIACGMRQDELASLQDLVDRNNLKKVATGTRRDDGKFVKHPDHKPPPIETWLKFHRAQRDIGTLDAETEEWNSAVRDFDMAYQELENYNG